MLMKLNVGLTDKLIRYGVAAFLISLHLMGIVKGWLGIGVLITAGLAMLTGLLSFCPLYVALGFTTRRVQHGPTGKYGQ